MRQMLNASEIFVREMEQTAQIVCFQLQKIAFWYH